MLGTPFIAIVIFVCDTFHPGFSSDVFLDVSPSSISRLNPPDNITVSCVSEGGFDPPDTEVLLLELRKDQERPIAILRQCSDLSFGRAKKSNQHIEGRLERNETRHFITMTVTNPTTNDAGKYTCFTVLVRTDGSMDEKTESSYVSVESLKLEDAVDYFVSKITNLEEIAQRAEDTVSKQKSAIAKLNEHIRDQVWQQRNQTIRCNEQDAKLAEQHSKLKELNSKLQEQETKLIDKESKLRQDIENQEKQRISNLNRINHLGTLTSNLSSLIGEIDERNSHMVAFSAAYNSKDAFVKGKSVVFGEVLMKTGTGYNESTGVFTAPKPGYYVFDLFITTTIHGVYQNVDIKVNGDTKARLFAYDSDLYGGQSSVSCFVNLHTGDLVHTVVDSSSPEVNSFSSYPFYSVFTGYLVKAV